MMSKHARRNRPMRALESASILLISFAVSCVERTVTINTEPQGATVVLNDQEVGKSPVRVPFTWYGDYDIIIRKEGCKTIQTHEVIRAPWYQWPVVDLFAECFIPLTLHDDRTLDTFAMEPYEAPNKDDLIQRSDEMKDRTAAANETAPLPE